MAKDIKFNIRILVDGKEQLVTATTSAADLQRTMERAKGSAARLRDTLLGYTQTVQAMQDIAGAVSRLAGTLNGVTEESRAFGAAMRAANTMAGKDAEGFARLKGQVADLSETIPLARDQLANGLYQVISNGVPEDNWISYLEASAKSAVGGIADVGEVVKVTSTIIKNYGLEWDAAGDIQDKIQLTAKNGVTSFEQLAAALPSVTGQAAQLGVSLTEMLAVMATLTGVTGNTAEVSTQLASVLTALTKESAKSQKAAGDMGIAFNAAGIKAAGGLRNYLQELDRTVTAYAERTGELKESVYSRLFGRAEALRLVNALTGQMAEKYDENIAALDSSTGTMREAYENMASTGASKLQVLKNEWGKYTDWIADKAGGIQPLLNFGSQLGMTVVSVLTLTEAFKKLSLAQSLMSKSVLRNIAAYALFGTNAKKAAAAVHVMSQSFRSASTGALALKIALRGLLAATGIGVALTAAGIVAGKLAGAFDKASESADGLSDSTRGAGDSTEAYKQAAASAKEQLDKEVQSLRELIRSGQSTEEAVRRLNETYGESFGVHKTAAEWYDMLTQKSKLYIKQIGYEAQAKALASKMAETAIEKEMAAERMEDLKRSGRDKQVYTTYMGMSSSGAVQTVSSMGESEEYKAARKQYEDLSGIEEELQGRLDVIAKKTGEIASELGRGLSGAAREAKASEMTWQQLSDAIDETEKKLKNTTDPAEIGKLKEYNARLKERKGLLEKLLGIGSSGVGAAAPAAGQSGGAAPAPGQVNENARNLEEIEANVRVLTDALQKASLEEAAAINRDIEAWRKKAEAIEEAGKASAEPAPGPAGELRTIGELTDALRYYRDLQKGQAAEEAAGTQRTIDALEAKLEAMRKLLELPSIEMETEGLEGLVPEELQTRLEVIGLDEVEERLAALRGMLDAAPEGLRGEIEKLIPTWEAYAEGLRAAEERHVSAEEAIGTTASSLYRLGDAVGGGAGEWIKWGASLMEAVSAAIPAIMQLIGTKDEETNANAKAAASGAAASVASIPFVGPIMAVAAIASIVAALAAIPKFAKGGIAYGPTLGVFGEYAGASSNPEVVAPLDRLRGLLAEPQGAPGKVEFEIKGRALVGVLNKENNIARRS